MTADVLLSRLDKARRTGQDRWIACCPAHGDKSPSLAVRELDDGRVLIHCFAGCDVSSVLSAVNLEMDDLFPPRPLGEHFKKGERRPFVGADVLHAMDYEVKVIVLTGAAMADGTATVGDFRRCLLAAKRFKAGLEAAGVSP
jgi:hypothetical protein